MAQLEKLVEEGKITDPESARGRLLGKAAHLFKTKGYERTTVRDLAASVGIQSGSIFHHFKSKEDILFAVMEETILFITAKMEDALSAAETPEEKLLALIRCELESILGDTSEAMTVLVYEWRSLSEARQQEILLLRNHYENLWLECLQEAIRAKQVKGDAFVLRRFLTGALSWTVTWYKSDGPYSMDDLAKQALGLLVQN